jgi:hypothetical protein
MEPYCCTFVNASNFHPSLILEAKAENFQIE